MRFNLTLKNGTEHVQIFGSNGARDPALTVTNDPVAEFKDP